MASDDRALASIINAARNASRRERTQSLMETTRTHFRPGRTQNRVAGRNKKRTWKKALFLLRRSNSDFYPSATECSYLEQHGLGKSTGNVERHWSINRLQRYICQLFPLVPLEDTGFRFAKCGRNKKLVIIPAVNNIAELEAEVGRSMLVIAPNRDLDLPEVDTANNSGTLTRTRTTRTRTTRTAQPRTQNRAEENSSSESDDAPIPTAVVNSDRLNTSTNRTSSSRPNTSAVITSTRTAPIESDDSDFELQPPHRFNLATIIEDPFSLNIPSTSVDLYNSGDEETCNETPLMQFPNLVDDPIEIITLEVNRETVLAQMLEFYNKNDSLNQKAIKVIFKDEVGLDYGGLTKELFTVFWRECQIEYFRGENTGVPFLSLSKIRKGQAEDFVTIGRILAHTVLLTKSLPPYLANSFYLMLGNLDRKVPDHILLNDLLQFVTPSEKYLLTKAQTSFSSLKDSEKEMLIDFFQTYGLLENPKETEIIEQITIIAEKILCKESIDFVKKIKDGIPLFCESFFIDLTPDQLVTILNQQAPTPSRILRRLKTTPETLNNVQSQTVYFFKNYVKNLLPETLLKLLLFTTASQHMPEEIVLSLKSFGFPTAHTCSNTLELPIFHTQQELSRQFDAILSCDSSYQYSLL